MSYSYSESMNGMLCPVVVCLLMDLRIGLEMGSELTRTFSSGPYSWKMLVWMHWTNILCPVAKSSQHILTSEEQKSCIQLYNESVCAIQILHSSGSSWSIVIVAMGIWCSIATMGIGCRGMLQPLLGRRKLAKTPSIHSPQVFVRFL